MNLQVTALLRRFLSVSLSVSLAGLIFLTGTVPSFAAQSAGFSNFTKKHIYQPGQFSDLSGRDWFFDEVKCVYELGLMTGKSTSKFDPNGNITVGEAISMAAKTHNIYNGGTGQLPKASPLASGSAINTSGAAISPAKHWYDDAVQYALDQKIMTATDFRRLEAPATRAELAYLLAGATPLESLAPINAISSLPDVDEDTPYQDSILALYRAGILSGNDDYGAFLPDVPIIRGEAASILYRIAVPGERRSFSLRPVETPGKIEDPANPREMLSVFTDQKKSFTLSAPKGWAEPSSYRGTDSQLTLLLKQPPLEGRRGDVTAGEILAYVSSKKDAAAPLSIFHGLTVESLTKELAGRELSAPAQLFLPGDRPGYLSVLVPDGKENAQYWILSTENDGRFVTLVGRALKQNTVSAENQVISVLKTLTFLPAVQPAKQ